MKRVIVVGGGWAGCSAAHELATRGWKVTLVERSKVLGGRAGSVWNSKIERELDCGQHLFLGAYEHSFRLLRALGTADGVKLAGRLEVDYYSTRGLIRFRAWPLPGPLALAGALLRFPLLSFSERREALFFGLRGWRGIFQPQSVKRLTAASWLKRCGQSPGVISKFWEPLCLAALNAPSERAPASLLAVALGRGFLRGGKAAALGLPLKPLSQLLQPALADRLKDMGSEVRLGLGVKSTQLEKDGVKVVLEDGEVLDGDAVVLALPASLAAKQADLELKEAAAIEGSPILTAHVFTFTPILPSAWGVFAPEGGDSGFEFQWAFDRTQLLGERGPHGETWNCFLVSAARRMAGMPQESILLELKRQLARRLKGFDPSQVTQAFVLKEGKATPLFEPLSPRPTQKTRFPNLALAGDWTDTGLPATIEGAVLSGLRAADALD